MEHNLGSMEAGFQEAVVKNEKEYNDKLEELNAMFHENKVVSEKNQ
jgi:hypothetical protein